jgi:hypothetical protein
MVMQMIPTDEYTVGSFQVRCRANGPPVVEHRIPVANVHVEALRVPEEGIARLRSASMLTGKKPSLWCRVSGPTEPVRETGFCLEGQLPWRAVHQLLPATPDFAPLRSFLQYAKQELRCTEYSLAFHRQIDEQIFVFTKMDAIGGETDPLAATFALLRPSVDKFGRGSTVDDAPLLKQMLSYSRPRRVGLSVGGTCRQAETSEKAGHFDRLYGKAADALPGLLTCLGWIGYHPVTQVELEALGRLVQVPVPPLDLSRACVHRVEYVCSSQSASPQLKIQMVGGDDADAV